MVSVVAVLTGVTSVLSVIEGLTPTDLFVVQQRHENESAQQKYVSENIDLRSNPNF